MLRIAIIGTRGIPNFHGGFEQFAEYISQYLANHGFSVFVYCSRLHPYRESQWKDVRLVHCKDPEDRIGTAGQFVYDLNCIWHARKSNYDLILQLGYTSSSVWGWLLPRKPVIVTNMDGLEWKRSKYSKKVRVFLKYAEKLAIKYSDYLVADSLGIQSYLMEEYQVNSDYIPYGARVFSDPNALVLEKYNLNKYAYNLLIARLEPENNIVTILDGVVASNSNQPFLVIGKHQTKYGSYLKKRYKDFEKIRFLGGIYHLDDLNNLRYWSNLYFHGHSVGGTNPSLLEAMASSGLIIAHDNVFNRSILGTDALYFKSDAEVTSYLSLKKEDYREYLNRNLEKIRKEFNWEQINSKYMELIKKVTATE